jgi:hypothetical protein
VLQPVDGRLIDRVPVRFAAVCPDRHEGRGSADIDLTASTIDGFRSAIEAAVERPERCSTCRGPISVTSLRAFYEFEDGTGIVVAGYAGKSWSFGYGVDREAAPLAYGGIKNEDCRAELGRVFSLRDRWPELVGHYLQRGRTIMSELVAPGYACFVVRADCTAQVRSLARVSVPEYRPESTHLHVRVDPPAGLAGAAREHNLVLEAVVDTDWAEHHIGDAGLDPRRIAREAGEAARLLREQVLFAITPPAA